MRLLGGNLFGPVASAGGGGGLSSLTSPNSSITVGGTLTDPTLDIALGYAPVWTAAHTFARTDAARNTVLRPLVLRRLTSDASHAQAALGVGTSYELEDDTNDTAVEAGRLDLVWSDPATASKDSSFALSVQVANSLVEAVRFGGGATLPDVDFTTVLGRCRFDSRVTDTAFFSHRDMTAAAQFAIRQTSGGGTIVGCANNQSVNIAHFGTNRITVGATGLSFFAAAQVAQQTVGAVTNSVTAGGTDGTIADYTIVDYATDAAAIRNNQYQLARSVAQLATAIRNLGLGA